MNVFICETEMTVGEAPIGLFLLKDSREIICISEYRSGPGDDQSKYTRDAYIVSSGENYWGEGDDAIGQSIIIE